MSALAAISSAPPLERATLGEQVYAHIRRLLIAGRLAPGDRLSLGGGADLMGVSMMPVREAVSRLVADQAIEVTPNRALRVPVMRRRQFAELATIRAEIEGFAAERAATARTPAQLRAIVSAERRFGELAQAASPDLPAAVEANQAFHFAVYEASGLADLVGVIAVFGSRSGRSSTSICAKIRTPGHRQRRAAACRLRGRHRQRRQRRRTTRHLGRHQGRGRFHPVAGPIAGLSRRKRQAATDDDTERLTWTWDSAAHGCWSRPARAGSGWRSPALSCARARGCTSAMWSLCSRCPQVERSRRFGQPVRRRRPSTGVGALQ